MTVKVSICICTYKRPELLGPLFSKLSKLRSDGLFDLNVIIVDNDSSESARQIVEYHANDGDMEISYFVEPVQNISLARNRAIKNSSGELVALIDDDEFPEDDWLTNLYRCMIENKADGILGPVLPHFAEAPPAWVLKGRLFERPTHKTGCVLDWRNTRTGNVLLKRKIFENNDNWFDPEFGSGGEDRDFFRRKIAEGYTFKWCNEAPVYEIIPSGRWSKSVLLKRALIRGKMALNSRQEGKIAGVLRSIMACFVYTLGLPFFYLMGEHIFMKYLIKNCDHMGKVLAFLGYDPVKEKYISA